MRLPKAQFRAHWFDDVVCVQVIGLYANSTADQLRHFMIELSEKRQPFKALVDLRSAMVLLDEVDLSNITQRCVEDPFDGVPTGLLVPPIYEDLVWRHCLQMIAKGYARVPFVSVEDASAWLGVPHTQLAEPGRSPEATSAGARTRRGRRREGPTPTAPAGL